MLCGPCWATLQSPSQFLRDQGTNENELSPETADAGWGKLVFCVIALLWFYAIMLFVKSAIFLEPTNLSLGYPKSLIYTQQLIIV